MSNVSLQALDCLSKITNILEGCEDSITATRLKRDYSFDDRIFEEAVAYGHENNIVSRGKFNKISLIKGYSIPEEAYYPSIGKCINDLWIKEGHERSGYYLENTSRRDSRIAGPWTRPDFTLISHKKFPWTIGHEFDVVTFEVKRPDSCNVLAVFEALSHASVATRAYVVFPLDEKSWIDLDAAQARRVKEECVRHGIGLILVEKICGPAKPVHFIRATKREIDHEKCNSFLSSVVSDEGKKQIARWK
ncbi:hypothetical protein [Azospirillum brasilense]|uniref:hypothetical protein n=1 Tax=Azospirillum brasilense TaxID=192 RepID=UPI0013B3F4D7|nr:hypothetical protein [Azospirillum brasilense]